MTNQQSTVSASRARWIVSGSLCAAAMAIVPSSASADTVTDWNVIGVNATGNWRAPTIAQLAMYDALNAIERRYEPYAVDLTAPADTSPDAAVAAAAHRVLVLLVPSQRTTLDAAFAATLASIPAGPQRDAGVALGEEVAVRMVQLRSTDGFTNVVSYIPIGGIGHWVPTPPGFAAAASPQWALMQPFGYQTASQFRPDAPPDLTSELYTRDYLEIQQFGSRTDSSRTDDDTAGALYWDTLTSPAYNRIARAIMASHPMDMWDTARALALVNMVNSDANIGCWDAKYTYGFWRPVTAIRRGDEDNNPSTHGDPTWTPLIDTPNHPDYTAGHTCSAGAVMYVLGELFGDDIDITTVGGHGVARRFTSVSGIAQDTINGRVAAGVHFRNSCEVGARLGRQLAQFGYHHYLRPVHGGGHGHHTGQLNGFRDDEQHGAETDE